MQSGCSVDGGGDYIGLYSKVRGVCAMLHAQYQVQIASPNSRRLVVKTYVIEQLAENASIIPCEFYELMFFFFNISKTKILGSISHTHSCSHATRSSDSWGADGGAMPVSHESASSTPCLTRHAQHKRGT